MSNVMTKQDLKQAVRVLTIRSAVMLVLAGVIIGCLAFLIR